MVRSNSSGARIRFSPGIVRSQAVARTLTRLDATTPTAPWRNSPERRRLLVPLLLVTSLVIAASGRADALDGTIGLHVGVPPGGKNRGFHQAEMVMEHPVFPRASLGRGVSLGAVLRAGVGALAQGGDAGLIAAIGPHVELQAFGDRFTIAAGTSPTFISDSRFPGRDLGGSLQFVSAISVGIHPLPRVGVMLGFQHMSNASIRRPNPGLNLVKAGVVLRAF